MFRRCEGGDRLFLVSFTLLHALASYVAVVVLLVMNMSRFDRGVLDPGGLEATIELLAKALCWPLLGLAARPSMAGLLLGGFDVVVIVLNSLLSGIAILALAQRVRRLAHRAR
jgi:hypothetical protein